MVTVICYIHSRPSLTAMVNVTTSLLFGCCCLLGLVSSGATPQHACMLGFAYDNNCLTGCHACMRATQHRQRLLVQSVWQTQAVHLTCRSTGCTTVVLQCMAVLQQTRREANGSLRHHSMDAQECCGPGDQLPSQLQAGHKCGPCTAHDVHACRSST